eukprot:533132-Hanusia_phi.AAC.1
MKPKFAKIQEKRMVKQRNVPKTEKKTVASSEAEAQSRMVYTHQLGRGREGSKRGLTSAYLQDSCSAAGCAKGETGG